MAKWFWKGCKPNSVCAACAAERIICLCSQYPEPDSLARTLERAAPGSPIWPCTRWGFPCPADYSASGGLLHHLFTLAPLFLKPSNRHFDSMSTNVRRTICAHFGSRKSGAVCFLWHCPSGCLTTSPPACTSAAQARVTRHRALWCSDFPPPTCAGSDPPPFQNRRQHTAANANSQAPNRRLRGFEVSPVPCCL